MSIRKYVGSKVRHARVVGGFIRNSLVFKLKRQALRPRYWFRKVNLIVVDMDGTLFEDDAGRWGLKVAYPDRIDHSSMGDILHDAILQNLSKGELSVEEAIIDGNRLLQYRGFTRDDFQIVLKKMWPSLRKELVYALKELQNEGKHIVLATLSSKEFADMVNDELIGRYGFGFDGIIGTQVSFDAKGKMDGVKDILGLRNGTTRGVKVRTKLSATRELARTKRWKFALNHTVLITDSYGDIDMAKHVKTILLVPRKPTRIQAVSADFRLADRIIPTDRYMKEEILFSFGIGKRK
ncbi:MAG: HAD family hydrolase [Candidatus Diapherotrites archaeon]|nr:HAD family hydrolase [Candidatus Diapherotrites archaeon]